MSETNDYAVQYRWEWFRRARWRAGFRERKRASPTAFAELFRERGLADRPVLDCSCGLGLKTICMKELGLHVEGSDGCAVAIELARRLAVEEGHDDLRYFAATWAELPQATDVRYAAVFNDALCWIESDADMAAALRGLRDALQPGGLLVYMGAAPGAPPRARALLDEAWSRIRAEGRFRLGFRHAEAGVAVTETLARERGPDFIDEHHLYVIEESGERRLEVFTARQVYAWDWDRIEPILRAADFRRFTSQAVGPRERPVHLVAAERE